MALAPLEDAPGVDISHDQDGGLFKELVTEGDASSGSPPVGSKVKVHYVGTLLDGSKFDSSRDRPGFFEFKVGVGQVIKGWDQGICTMKKGEVCTLTCRHDYAYGESGHPPKIPAGATLKFEVELFGWKEERKQKWELDEAGKQATAAELKEKGTAALKAGSNDEAYELYVDAASYVEGESAEPARALLLSCQLNAAAAALKLKEWALAEAAAGKALAVEPASVKALYRRGTARMHGGDFAAAKADLRAAATADPKDRAVRDAFAECGRREAEAKKAERAVAARMFS